MAWQRSIRKALEDKDNRAILRRPRLRADAVNVLFYVKEVRKAARRGDGRAVKKLHERGNWLAVILLYELARYRA